MASKWVVLWIVAACATAACSRQEAGWQDALRENSIAAYQQYLENFPAGAHAADARAKVLELREHEAWMRANRLQTPEAWQRYLGDWPDGRHAALARRQLVAFMPPGQPEIRGDFAVQLGAYSSAAAARTDLARLSREHPAELAGLQLQIREPAEGELALWRLRAGPLDEAGAREMCFKLKPQGVDCMPVAGPSAGQAPP
ncbi:MAG: SPOR domain-containing protein [Steroidobacteraceae bacterium]